MSIVESWSRSFAGSFGVRRSHFPTLSGWKVPVAIIVMGVAGAVVLMVTMWLVAGYAMRMKRQNAALESRVRHLEASQHVPQGQFPAGVALGRPVNQKKDQSPLTNQAWGQESHALTQP